MDTIKQIKKNCRDPQDFIFSGLICQIPLYNKKGKFVEKAVIDSEDYHLVKDYKFYYHYGYAKSDSFPNKFKFLHQIILGIRGIDHKYGDTLDNRKKNLRKCTQQQNMWNQKVRIGGTSKYKGVSIVKRKTPYRAMICVDYKNIYLGVFKKEKDAAVAYNVAALKYFGEFARLNYFPKNE